MLVLYKHVINDMVYGYYGIIPFLITLIIIVTKGFILISILLALIGSHFKL